MLSSLFVKVAPQQSRNSEFTWVGQAKLSLSPAEWWDTEGRRPADGSVSPASAVPWLAFSAHTRCVEQFLIPYLDTETLLGRGRC